jgi:Uncharacterised nucleotidyltransferase
MESMADPVTPTGFIPTAARVALSHAAVEVLALDAEIDLLHIKGPAVLPGLRPPDHTSNDVDVLVRPADLDRFERTLAAHGWDRRSSFESGSAFQHAANWYHPSWGYVDVHAHWPGPRVDADQVFAEFAEGGHRQEIAHVACRVPNRAAQILILVLHAGRTPGRGGDIVSAWDAIAPEEQATVRALAVRLRAETGLAAGLGDLDSVTDDPSTALWRVHSRGGTRIDEWHARLRAAPDRRAAARVLVSSLAVNRDSLRMELGRPPTRADVARRQWQRVRRLLRDLVALTRRRLSRRP